MKSGRVSHSGVFALGEDSCLCPSRQQRSGSWTFFFYWPCRLWWIGLLRRPHGGFFLLGVSCAGLNTHGGSLVALPEVGLLGMGCWHIVRVPQNLCLTPLPGVRSMLLFFVIAVWMLLQETPLTRSMESSPKPGQGLSVSAFKGCSSALNASRSEVTGSPVLLSNYVALVLSRGPGILSSFCHPSWVVSLVLQNLVGAPWNSYGHMESVFFFWF